MVEKKISITWFSAKKGWSAQPPSSGSSSSPMWGRSSRELQLSDGGRPVGQVSNISDADVLPVHDGEERAEPKGEALSLLVCLDQCVPILFLGEHPASFTVDVSCYNTPNCNEWIIIMLLQSLREYISWLNWVYFIFTVLSFSRVQIWMIPPCCWGK